MDRKLPGEPPLGRETDPGRLLTLASEHHRAGRMAEAERLYREIIAACPASAEAHRRLGLLYAQSGRLQGAVEEIGAAARLAPGEQDRVCIAFDVIAEPAAAAGA